jgi:hypothetical protein
MPTMAAERAADPSLGVGGSVQAPTGSGKTRCGVAAAGRA